MGPRAANHYPHDGAWFRCRMITDTQQFDLGDQKGGDDLYSNVLKRALTNQSANASDACLGIGPGGTDCGGRRASIWEVRGRGVGTARRSGYGAQSASGGICGSP